MKSIFFLFITFNVLIESITGCRTKCDVGCSEALLSSIGYSQSYLDTVTIKFYTPNGAFDSLIDSAVLVHGFNNVGIYSSWTTQNGDTIGDTLMNSYITINDGYDVDVYVNSQQRDYRYSNIHLTGSEEQNVYCHEGTPEPGQSCHRYLTSYTLNGMTYNFSSGEKEQNLYFSK